ncbi:hypothetical protein DFH09DRAFT_927410, partial [Mycena vulgaris]
IESKTSALPAELTRFDAKSAKFQQQLDELGVQRGVIHSHYNDFKGLLAPIRRLPSELLGDIFGLCWHFAPVAEESASLVMERVAKAPLLALSQVCARWHDIALGTPALWGRIEPETVLWSDPTHNDAIMRLPLERSANHPLVVVGASSHGLALELLAQHSHVGGQPSPFVRLRICDIFRL